MTDHIVDANKLVRAEFEAWAHKTHYNLGVGPNGLYQSGKTSSAWASWQAATQRQQERIAELQAQVQALSMDAGRLDYLQRHARSDPKMDGNHVWWPTSFNQAQNLTGPTLREAIDAAIDVEKGGQE